jgi:hypothetical protein
MTRGSRRLLFVTASIAAAIAVVGTEPIALAAPSGLPATSCTSKAYAYAGLTSNVTARGIKATVTTLTAALVPDGHVAGWIGVGGTDAGPNGQAEWLQAGLNTQAGSGSELYAEITQPGVGTTYKTLLSQIVQGTPYRLAVFQVPTKPSVWQVWLNGKPVTGEIYLPDSGSFQPMAMSESWNGGTPTCNGFSYRFDRVQIATHPGSWRALTDASTLSDLGYQITNRSTAGFTAASG